jgi:hypothetical protein
MRQMTALAFLSTRHGRGCRALTSQPRLLDCKRRVAFRAWYDGGCTPLAACRAAGLLSRAGASRMPR